MLEVLQSPDRVAAFAICGTLTGGDYDRIVAEVEAKLARHERIGVLLGELVTSAAKGELDLPVDAVFGLDQVIEAVTASGEPGRKGKVVLRG